MIKAPKKLKLSDYEIKQTLGTGLFQFLTIFTLARLIW